MKVLLFPLLAVSVSSGSLLAQNGKSLSDSPNMPLLQYSNIGEYSNDCNKKLHFAVGYNTRIEDKLMPQLMMDPMGLEELEAIVDWMVGIESKTTVPVLIQGTDFSEDIQVAERAKGDGIKEKEKALKAAEVDAAEVSNKTINTTMAYQAADEIKQHKIDNWKQQTTYLLKKYEEVKIINPVQAIGFAHLAQTYETAVEQAWLAENIWRGMGDKKAIQVNLLSDAETRARKEAARAILQKKISFAQLIPPLRNSDLFKSADAAWSHAKEVEAQGSAVEISQATMDAEAKEIHARDYYAKIARFAARSTIAPCWGERVTASEQAIKARENEGNSHFEADLDQRDHLLRNIDRARVRVKADRAAWEAFWPREALAKDVEGAEATFNHAIITKTEVNWVIARNKAQDLLTFWNNTVDNHNRLAEEERIYFTTAIQHAQDQKTLWNQKVDLIKDIIEVNIRSAQIMTKAEAAWEKAQTIGGEIASSWKEVGNSLEKASEYWKKTIEFKIQGNLPIVEEYKKAAEQSEIAAEKFTQAVKVLLEGKENCILWNEGYALQKTADYQVKAIEAEAANQDVATKYRETAEKQSKAADYYAEAAKAYAEEKTSEAIYWNNAGNGCYNAAEKLVKAIDADIAADIADDIGAAQKWREAAEKQEESVKHFAEAAKVRRNGKKYEGINWNNAGRSFYNAAEKLVKAIEAEVAGESGIPEKYRKAAEIQENAVEHFIKAAKAYKNEKLPEGDRWNSAGNGFYNSAEKLVKAIEADAADNARVAEKYREAAEQQEISVDHYKKAAEAYAEGKISKAIDCNNKGNKFYYHGISLSRAVEQIVTAIQEEGSRQSILDENYRDPSTQFQQSAQTTDRASSEGNSTTISNEPDSEGLILREITDFLVRESDNNN